MHQGMLIDVIKLERQRELVEPLRRTEMERERRELDDVTARPAPEIGSPLAARLWLRWPRVLSVR